MAEGESGESRTMIRETADGKRLVVRTESLEDKATACRMLACFVQDMKGAFRPYVDQVCTVAEGVHMIARAEHRRRVVLWLCERQQLVLMVSRWAQCSLHASELRLYRQQ